MPSEAGKLGLVQAESISLLILMDNYVDVLLPGDRHVTRPRLGVDGRIPTDTLLAEHGLCVLLEIAGGGRGARVLLDAGYSQVGVPHNLDRLGVDLKGVEAVVLSHGHMDHFGSLPEVLRRVGAPAPLVLHPGALRPRRFLDIPQVGLLAFPELRAEDLIAAGARMIEAEAPYLSPGGLWAATGTVERANDFEKGLAIAVMEQDGAIAPDPIADDMAVVVDLAGKGLVVISGCAHAGIVNTVRYAMKLTGRDKVHAVVGGFHLGGPAFEPIIERTVAELRGIGPEVVMPMHCTGRRAMVRLEQEFGEAFVLSSVGSTLQM